MRESWSMEENFMGLCLEGKRMCFFFFCLYLFCEQTKEKMRKRNRISISCFFFFLDKFWNWKRRNICLFPKTTGKNKRRKWNLFSLNFEIGKKNLLFQYICSFPGNSGKSECKLSLGFYVILELDKDMENSWLAGKKIWVFYYIWIGRKKEITLQISQIVVLRLIE